MNANTLTATIGKGLARAERQAGCDWAERHFGQHFEIERITGTETPRMWKWLPGFAAYLMTRKGSCWAPPRNIDGELRILGGSVAMGADEIPSDTEYSIYQPLILRSS